MGLDVEKALDTSLLESKVVLTDADCESTEGKTGEDVFDQKGLTCADKGSCLVIVFVIVRGSRVPWANVRHGVDCCFGIPEWLTMAFCWNILIISLLSRSIGSILWSGS